MKVVTGAVIVGAMWWGAANVVDDAPPQLEPPVVELEAGPVAGPEAMPVGAFCPLSGHSGKCQLRPTEPAQLSRLLRLAVMLLQNDEERAVTGEAQSN